MGRLAAMKGDQPHMAKRGKPIEFHPTKKIQRGYEQGIKRITAKVLLKPRPEQSYSQWVASLIQRSQEPDIVAASDLLAKRMVVNIAVGNQRTWREAASRSMRSQMLHRALRAELQGPTGARMRQIVRENAKLIRSVPIDSANYLVDEIAKAQQNGARPKTVAKMAKSRFPQLLKSRTNLIARTETAKASTALTQSRCERLNVEWYQWETADDQRTRLSHQKMDGVIVPWGHPPAPEALVGEKSQGHYHAGEIYNCRCVVIPILTLEDVTFPARVYWNGAVKIMGKQEFKKIAVGLESREAAMA